MNKTFYSSNHLTIINILSINEGDNHYNIDFMITNNGTLTDVYLVYQQIVKKIIMVLIHTCTAGY